LNILKPITFSGFAAGTGTEPKRTGTFKILRTEPEPKPLF